MKNYKLERLQSGETFITKERGNSMLPLIASNQEHVLAPCSWSETKIDDIVYCKVRGRFITHKVIAKDDNRGCLIANNKGHVNGWTKQIYGRVIDII
jgi:hypothetical protein